MSIPLILKCVLGYAVASAFDQVTKDPRCLLDAQKNSLKKADDVIKDLGKGKLTQEQSMQIINNRISL